MRHLSLWAGLLLAVATTAASAGTVSVPYAGVFDEATVAGPVDGLPAGDYDTIGGLSDVGLFQLVAGANVFHGSIVAPADTSDVFLVEVLAGYRLTGATILWGTNLPDNFGAPLEDYRYQSTGRNNQPPAPNWYLEESSVTPEIFTIAGLWDGAWGEAPKLFSAPALDVGPGIYSSALIDQGGTCILKQVPYTGAGGGLVEVCDSEQPYAQLDYIMTFTVERLAPQVPLPAGLALYIGALGVAGLGAGRRRRRNF